ncbi:MAG: dihydrodipicolinate synthase family protein [Anaerolineales bacterium]|nr:dihydrodipicolinate synthase family protein [Anaerolineales bacterium]
MTNSLAASQRDLRGVYAAAVTPLQADLTPDLAALPALLDFLAQRGCHGALLLGTTGEGTSFSVAEHLAIIGAGVRYRDTARPGYCILAGTGAASLSDAMAITRGAFELGVDGVVTLPAFYYKGVSAAGLVTFYEAVLRAAVPVEGRLLAYHIPQTSGVGLPAETLETLRARYPRQFWGMKDSQDDLAHTLGVLAQLPGFGVFAGSDAIMAGALAGGGAGAITALANVTAPLNRAVWDAHQAGQTEAVAAAQAKLVRARQVVKGLSGPAIQKAALAELFGFPRWPVRPPLEPVDPEREKAAVAGLAELLA